MYFFVRTGEYGKRTDESDEMYCDKGLGWMAIPTWDWTDSMWDMIHSVAGNERYALASHFRMGIHDWDGRDASAECNFCHLNPEDVGVRFLNIFDKQLMELMEEDYYND